MFARLIFTRVILVIAVVLTAVPFPVDAQSICVEDLNVEVGEELKTKLEDSGFEAAKVKARLLERLEARFIQNHLEIKSCKEDYDFSLQGTVEVLDMLQTTHGFLFSLSADALKIIPSKNKVYLPAMAFEGIRSSDHPRADTSHSTVPAVALRDALDCFIERMDSKEIFYFHKHPLFREKIDLQMEKLEQVYKNTQEQARQLKKMLVDVKNEIIHTTRVTMEARLSAFSKEIRAEISANHRRDLDTFPERIQGLENRLAARPSIAVTELETVKTEFRETVQQFNTAVTDMKQDSKLLNYVIVYVDDASQLPREFEQTYIEPETCNNCSANQIKADNIKEITPRQEIDLLKQNADYAHPLELSGKIVNNNGVVTVRLAEADYNRIYELDSGCNLPAGELLKSIKDSTDDYPRLFIMEKKKAGK